MFCRFPAPFLVWEALVSDSTQVCIFLCFVLCPVQAGEEVAASTHFLSPKLRNKTQGAGVLRGKLPQAPTFRAKYTFWVLKPFQRQKVKRKSSLQSDCESHPFQSISMDCLKFLSSVYSKHFCGGDKSFLSHILFWSIKPTLILVFLLALRANSCSLIECRHCLTWQPLPLKNWILSFLLALIESRGVTSALNPVLA